MSEIGNAYSALQPYKAVPGEGSGTGGSGRKNELPFSMEGRYILD